MTTELTAVQAQLEVDRFNAVQAREGALVRARFDVHVWAFHLVVYGRGSTGGEWKAFPLESWPRDLETLREGLRSGVVELRLRGVR